MTIKKVRKFIEVFNHELLVSPKEIIYDEIKICRIFNEIY